VELTVGLILLFCATGLLVHTALASPMATSTNGRRLRRWKASLKDEAGPWPAAGVPLREWVLRPALRTLGRAVHRSEKETSRTQDLLMRAGYEDSIEPVDIFAMQLAFALLAVGASAVLLISPRLRTIGLLVMAITGILAWRLPVANLENRAKSRQREFQRAMPDVLDLLAISVEAGLSFDQGIGRVAEEFGGVVKEEVENVLKGMKVGRSRAEALRMLDRRVATPDVKTFVGAIIQAETLGASIGHVLKVQAASLRVKRRQTAQERAAQTPVKLLIPIVTLIFPTIFLIILTPAVIHMLQVFHTGQL